VSSELLSYFGALIVGMELNDLEQVDRVVQRMHSAAQYWGRSGVSVEAISAIEVACLDVLGKRNGVPVVDLLGGAVHERLPVYASGGLAGTDDELRAELDRHLQAGYRRVKMRVGWGPEVDVNRVRVAREHVGDGFSLAVDAVKGHDPNPWSADQALELIRELKQFELDWFEEPCAAEDIDGYARVRSEGGIPVSGGESTARLRGFERLTSAGALDILQPDSVVCGGILEMLRIDALAERHGLRVAPHSWGSPVVLAANYHAGFAMRSCFTLERPVYQDALNARLWVEEPTLGPDGMVARPTAPGLGVQLPDDVLEEFAYQGEITSVRVPPVLEPRDA
jgi:L-alanine-DL-glutamate epimerase-like enolase superfamily enzyme